MAEEELLVNTGGSENTLRHRKFIKQAQETLHQASELIKRRVPCAGYLLSPKRLWLNTVSSPNCDVVVIFSSQAKESVISWLLDRIKECCELTVSVRQHVSTQTTAFYITAPFLVLIKAAEEFHLPKQLKASKGGGLKEFAIKDSHCFENFENDDLFFTSQEKQWLQLRLLESIRCEKSDLEAFSELNLVEGQPIIPRCVVSGVIIQVYPLHEIMVLEKLQNSWVRDFFSRQPLDDICNYFGVKIAMYFAWLGHYTTALSIPALVGFIFWLCCDGQHQNLEDIGYVIFSIFNIVWVTTYLQAWKRYSAELAFRWGTLDQRTDLLADARPLFTGPLQPSPVTGRLEPWQPAWRRHVFRYCVTIPTIAVCLATVFFVMTVSFHIQDWWDSHLESREFPLWLGYVPKVMLAIVISLMDEAYFKVALWLNDKENYRLETKYENHLIGKVAVFQFVNSFLSLFYIAFYLQDQARLKEQLAALLISRQIIGNLKESAWPYMLEHLRLAKLSLDLWGVLTPTDPKSLPGDIKRDSISSTNSKDSDEQESSSDTTKVKTKRSMSQAEFESTLFKYNGTFADHLEMTVQLGYVILFSSAFPPAALCAMLNNLIEIRSDAFKLVYVCQRPFGQRVSNIGTWHNCMEYMSIIAVLVNCALIGLSGQVHRMFPDMTATQTILLIVCLEHIMLGIRFAITCAIPEIPGWLATEMAKIEWARREASRLSNTRTASPFDPSTKRIGRFIVKPNRSSPTTSASKQTFDEKDKSEQPMEQMKKVPSFLSSLNTLPLTSTATPSPSRSVSQTPSTPVVTSSTTSTSSSVVTPVTPAGHSNSENRRVLSITPDSIQQIPPFKPRKSKEWVPPEALEGNNSYHLTVGPTGGVEWVRKLKDEVDVHKSSDCIAKEASSSDSDLLRSSPTWTARPRSPSSGNSSKAQPELVEKALGESNRSISSQEADDQLKSSAEDLAAKKNRVRQSLMKRARSVAIFSLKLKERRAREAQEKANKPPVTPTTPLPNIQPVGGELSCIPIEKLIQLEDVKKQHQRFSQSGTL
ncbi:anoctamin-8 [Agrilus planipennis]|uniref:Anoctamin n=1 Tax=Agrilus planipennis TaxID=224129 RepID=A0A1W4X945_AGRPL|nr:anoctamin-8 [Agrilus planipennis]